MNWTNYHSHTTYSDGSDQPEVFAEAAIKAGLLAYGFADHGPNPFHPKGNVGVDKIETYTRHIRRLQDYYKDQIELYCALEVDYIPGYMHVQHEAIQQADLDYTVGSVHHVGIFSEEKLFGIEGSEKGFEKGRDELFGGDVRALLERYFELMREMVQTACPTIIAHMDRIKKNNFYKTYFSEDEQWYKEAVEKTLAVIAESDAIVEINTKSFYRNYTTDPDPSLWIVELLQEHNIPVHLSSDAHRPEDIVRAFDVVQQQLRKIGFQSTKVLLEGEWQDQPIVTKAQYSVS